MGERVRKWWLIGLAALAMVGCGESDEDQVRSTAEEFFVGLADRDLEETCDLMTLEAQDNLMEQLDSRFCSSALGELAVIFEDGGVDLDSIVIDRVDVEGESARVGLEDDSTTFDLVKVDGEWLLEELP